MQKYSSFMRILAFWRFQAKVSALLHYESEKEGSRLKISVLLHDGIGTIWITRSLYETPAALTMA
ncbi:hypothetical protein [Paenibacillus sp. YN15]|uniref:hypothetical protein n=1 Tax=Paenibacillus sp. YN15 TaxID=1742774 RepID=UPI0011BF5D0F|nr:hypothetical protein [Paenibacillus sp. YN15]